MRHHSIGTVNRRAVMVTIAALLTISGCASQATPADPGAKTRAPTPAFRILPDPTFGSKAVSPIQPVELSVTAGTLRSIALTNEEGKQVAGKLSADEQTWKNTEPLGFGRTYTWTGTAIDSAGERFPISGSFRTVTPETLVTASSNLVPGGLYPPDAELRVTFSASVPDRSVVQRALKMHSAAAGEWTWAADGTAATWRPTKGWKPGTKARLVAELYGLRMADGVYGATDLQIDFQIQQA